MVKRHSKYTYRVKCSLEDAEYVGLCAEFPGLSWLARAPESVLRGIGKLVTEVIEDMECNGEPVPEPIALRNYIGKFVVRIPSEVHRQLAQQAAEAGVSINSLASAKLSRQNL